MWGRVPMEQHGVYTVRTSGQFMLISCSGTWNHEAAIRYARSVMEQAAALAPGPWCSLADLRRWELGTPDATAPIVELSQRLSALGRRHAAAVVGEIELVRSVGEHIFSRLPGDLKPEYRFFQTRTDAREWLQQLGYAMGPGEQDY